MAREVGLRVATHGLLEPHTSKIRHSHHTTQFLFAEYFTHDSANKPFAADEPGLAWSVGRPDVLYRADAKQQIDLGPLFGKAGKRGDPMPAILVARETHEGAALHVPQSRSATGDDSHRSTQGNTVHTWFQAKAGKQKPQKPRRRAPTRRPWRPCPTCRRRATQPSSLGSRTSTA